MTSSQEYRIWDHEHRAELYLTPHGETADIDIYEPDGSQHTFTLDARGMRQLRLALQRIEQDMS